MAAGYDIGVSFSGSSSSAASLNSPFSVTGGGIGSAAVKPGNVTNYLIVAVLVLTALFLFFGRK